MAARGTITAIGLVKDGGTATAGLTAASTNGFIVAPGQSTRFDKLLFRVVNGTTAGTITIRAAGNGVDSTGAAQTSPYPSNAVFAAGASGDLTATWSTVAGTQMVGPLTSDRYTQPDGNLYVDFSTATGVTFEVFALPFTHY